MNNIDDLNEFYSLVKKLSTEGERVSNDLLAKIRERQKRERKEKLYSYPPKKSLSL